MSEETHGAAAQDDPQVCDCGNPDCPGAVTYRWPFKIIAEQTGPEPLDLSSYLSVRTTSWEWEGERTDLHDIFALIWAASLRCDDVASVQLISYVFTLDTEIYARLLFPVQEGSLAELAPGRIYMERLGRSSKQVFDLVKEAFGCSPSGPGDPLDGDADFEPEPDWVAEVRRILRLKPQRDYEFRLRPALDWSVFTSLKRGVTVAKIPEAAAARLKSAWGVFQPKTAEGVASRLIRTRALKNAVPHGVLARVSRLMSLVDAEDFVEPLIIPTESHVIALGRRSILSVAADCGRRAFDAERELIEQRREAEAEIFFSDSRCIWSDRLDPARFEALIGDLLLAERGVQRVRQVGGTRDRDDGRDFMLEWILPPVGITIPGNGQLPLMERRDIIAQIKIRNRGISKADMPGIRDTIEHHGCDGLLLVAFPRITSQLFDHLKELRRRGAWWIDWWCQPEIEHRIRKNPEIAVRYPDLLQLVRAA